MDAVKTELGERITQLRYDATRLEEHRVVARCSLDSRQRILELQDDSRAQVVRVDDFYAEVKDYFKDHVVLKSQLAAAEAPILHRVGILEQQMREVAMRT